MNTDAAREQMLNQQLRTWDVLADAVLDAVRAVPREAFVPAHYADLAFADFEVPIGHNETMLAPKHEGRILQALQLTRSDSVLCIGSGTGYLCACLGKLAGRVMGIEQHANLTAAAEESTQRTGSNANLTFKTEQFTADSEPGRFDAIVVTGSVTVMPANLRAALNPGGRLFVVEGEGAVQHAKLVTLTAEGGEREEFLLETVLKPLTGFEPEEKFQF